MTGQRPVVHLPKGTYSLDKTLVIPAGADLMLVGDGPENATMLNGGADPLIRIVGPTHAVIRNCYLNAGNNAVGILVENADQPGARITGEQLNSSGYEYGFVADGLQHAAVELHDHGHNGMQVIGAGDGTRPWTALFGGASSRGSNGKAGTHLYDVLHGGRLFVRDIWYEGNAYSMFDLTDSGEFAYHSGFMAPYDANHGQNMEWEKEIRQNTASLQLDGFRGKVALTLISVAGGDFRVTAPNTELKLYLLGFLTRDKITLGGPEVKGQVVAEHTKHFRQNATGLDSIEGVGSATPQFIRDLLQPLRTVKPLPPAPDKDGVTNVRFIRVWVNGKNGVRVQAAPGSSEK